MLLPSSPKIPRRSTMEILKTYDATALHSAGFMDARVLVSAAPLPWFWCCLCLGTVGPCPPWRAWACELEFARLSRPLASILLPADHCRVMPAQGDTGVAIMTSGRGELFAVNLTNPDQVSMAHYVHNDTASSFLCFFGGFGTQHAQQTQGRRRLRFSGAGSARLSRHCLPGRRAPSNSASPSCIPPPHPARPCRLPAEPLPHGPLRQRQARPGRPVWPRHGGGE